MISKAGLMGNMDDNKILLIIMGISILAILGYAVIKKPVILLKMIARALTGAIAIHYINIFFMSITQDIGVGINPITMGMVSLLGFPGLLAVYCIGFYKNV